MINTDTPENLQDVLYAAIMAAGASTRLGQPKQLLQVNGVPLVVRAARQALTFCRGGVVIVTGDSHKQVVDALGELPVGVIYNPGWQEGLGASIRQGVAGVDENAKGILIMLVDQPMIDDSDFKRLISAWAVQPHRIAAASYGGSLGVPAIFPASYRERLGRLHGDRGASRIINDDADAIAVDLPHADFDLDTPSDLEALQRRLE
jgi:molybdenum cofactor cytidylyltransferase